MIGRGEHRDRSAISAFILSALALVGCGELQGPPTTVAGAESDGYTPTFAVVQKSVFPVAFSFLNPCTGDVVYFAGTQRFTRRSTSTNGDRLIIGVHVDMHLSGTGQPSGRKYEGQQALNITAMFEGDDLRTNSFVDRRLTLSQAGGGGDLHIFNTFHVTVNADGDVVSSVVEPTGTECRG